MTPREDKEGSVKTPCKKESSDYPAYAASVTAYDFLGRVVSVSTPNSSLLTPPSYSVTSNVYDGAADRLVSVSRTGSPGTLSAYDALGSVSATALDVGGHCRAAQVSNSKYMCPFSPSTQPSQFVGLERQQPFTTADAPV